MTIKHFLLWQYTNIATNRYVNKWFVYDEYIYLLKFITVYFKRCMFQLIHQGSALLPQLSSFLQSPMKSYQQLVSTLISIIYGKYEWRNGNEKIR